MTTLHPHAQSVAVELAQRSPWYAPLWLRVGLGIVAAVPCGLLAGSVPWLLHANWRFGASVSAGFGLIVLLTTVRLLRDKGRMLGVRRPGGGGSILPVAVAGRAGTEARVVTQRTAAWGLALITLWVAAAIGRVHLFVAVLAVGLTTWAVRRTRRWTRSIALVIPVARPTPDQDLRMQLRVHEDAPLLGDPTAELRILEQRRGHSPTQVLHHVPAGGARPIALVGGDVLELRFSPPEGAPASRFEGADRRWWEVRVTASLHGTRLAWVFVLPVFDEGTVHVG